MVGLQPGRHSRRELRRVPHHIGAGAVGLDRDHVVRLHLVRGNVNTAAVHRPVAMADQLPGLAAGCREAEADQDVVQAALEEAQQVLARNTLLPARPVVVSRDLLLEHLVVALGLLLLAQLRPVLGLAHPASAVLARRIGAALDAALVAEAARALQEELLPLTAALLALGSGVAGHQTLLRLRGRQPLWACGVTSFTVVTSRPAACSERIAVSRPDPAPFANTSTRSRPCSMPFLAAESAVTCAANGVDLREPLKPALPADSQAMTLPSVSVRVTIVLLKEVLMCACP